MNSHEIEELARGYFADFDARDIDGVASRFAAESVATMEPPRNIWRGPDGVRSWLTDILSQTSATDHATTRFSIDVGQRLAIFEQDVTVVWNDQPKSVLHNVTLVHFDADGLISDVTFWLGHDRRNRSGRPLTWAGVYAGMRVGAGCPAATAVSVSVR